MIRKIKKKLSFTFITIFILNFYFMPLAGAITVEEEAGKKKIGEKKPVIEDLSGGESGTRLFGRVVEERPHSQRDSGKDPRLACLLSLIIPGGGPYLPEERPQGYRVLSGRGNRLHGYRVLSLQVIYPGQGA